MTNILTTYKGYVVNGNLESWSGGLPTDFDVDQANTQVVQLQKEQQYLHNAGQPQIEVERTLALAPNIPIAANPLVKEGESALRFVGSASLGAGDFALRSEGITAAHTVAPTGQILRPEMHKDSRFSFWARGTEGQVFAVNLIVQTSGLPLYFQGNSTRQGPLSWLLAAQGGLDALTFEAQPQWQQYTINFQPLVFSGGFMDEDGGVTFEITNVSTGAFVLDIDDIEFENTGLFNERPV